MTVKIKTEQELDELLNQGPEAVKTYLQAFQTRDGLTEPPVERVPMSAEASKGNGDGHSPRGDRGPGRAIRGKWTEARDLPEYSDFAQGVELDSKFGRFGHFLTAVLGTQFGIHNANLKALGESAGVAGGFLVPEEFRALLLSLALEDALVRPRAFIQPMTSETLRIPAIHDASHATNVFGGVQAYWVGEAASITASEPSFKQLLLTAHKLTGYTQASNELLADAAIALEALLMRLFSEAIRFFEDDAFINGTGAGQPLGILNAPAAVTVAKETGQAATTIVLENLTKMYSRMLPRSLNRAIWVAHMDTFPQLASLSLAVGTGGGPVWIGGPGGPTAAGAPPTTIFGRPVIYTEHCQTLGTTGDIYLVDFGYYVIGDRQALSVEGSPHVRFQNDETVWRFVERLDGRPWLETALTPRHGSSTLSPIVKLATRA